MKKRQGVSRLYSPAEIGNRLNRTDLVVGVHDRHQRRLRPDRFGNGRGFDAPLTIHLHVCDAEPEVLFEPLAGVQHRVVFDARRDDVLPAVQLRLREGTA